MQKYEWLLALKRRGKKGDLSPFTHAAPSPFPRRNVYLSSLEQKKVLVIVEKGTVVFKKRVGLLSSILAII